MNRLTDQVAFVTGAGGGIGRAVCDRFLAEGAFVVAADLHLDGAAGAIASDTARGLAVRCDVSDPASVAEALANAAATFGRLTVLCNFAGGSTPQDGAVVDVADDEFWRAIRLDLYGTFLVAKHGLPYLIKAGGGAVINTTSIVATQAVPGLDCYTAAKGGTIALTRSMAAEYADHGVRVNAIAPGITLTPRVAARAESVDPSAPLVKKHLLGLVEPIDIAHLAVYLASDESRTMTGQILQVDSGATLT